MKQLVITTWKWTHPPEQEAKAGNALTTPREKGTELPLPLRLAVSSPRQNILAMDREAVLNENGAGGEVFDGTTTEEWRRQRMTAGHGRRTPCWIACFSPGCRQDTSQHNPRVVPRLVRIFRCQQSEKLTSQTSGCKQNSRLVARTVCDKETGIINVCRAMARKRVTDSLRLLPDASGIKQRLETLDSLSLSCNANRRS